VNVSCGMWKTKSSILLVAVDSPLHIIVAGVVGTNMAQVGCQGLHVSHKLRGCCFQQLCVQTQGYTPPCWCIPALMVCTVHTLVNLCTHTFMWICQCLLSNNHGTICIIMVLVSCGIVWNMYIASACDWIIPLCTLFMC
jgi:hypothetical protein